MNLRYETVVCKDGAKVSIQAGPMYKSFPNDNGPYSRVEAGFPSGLIPKSWYKYVNGHWFTGVRKPRSIIYDFLPVQMVDEYIQMHGGKVDGELPAFLYLPIVDEETNEMKKTRIKYGEDNDLQT